MGRSRPTSRRSLWGSRSDIEPPGPPTTCEYGTPSGGGTNWSALKRNGGESKRNKGDKDGQVH
jgi:hypothetical protein